MKIIVINFFAFELGWFACVFGAANGMPWLGMIVSLLIVLLHLYLVAAPRKELRLIALAVGMGLLFDSMLVSSGWVKYSSGMFLPGIAPYWILAMWAIFATTMNSSMMWIKRNLVVAVAMGVIFGPLSYLAGQRIGGLEFVNFQAAMIALSVIWGTAMPLLVVFARRINGVDDQIIPKSRLAPGPA